MIWIAIGFIGLVSLSTLAALVDHVKDSNKAIKLQMEINGFLRERIEALEKGDSK